MGGTVTGVQGSLGLGWWVQEPLHKVTGVWEGGISTSWLGLQARHSFPALPRCITAGWFTPAAPARGGLALHWHGDGWACLGVHHDCTRTGMCTVTLPQQYKWGAAGWEHLHSIPVHSYLHLYLFGKGRIHTEQGTTMPCGVFGI